MCVRLTIGGLLSRRGEVGVVPIFHGRQVSPYTQLSLFLVILVHFICVDTGLFVSHLHHPTTLICQHPPICGASHLRLKCDYSGLSLFGNVLFLQSRRSTVGEFPHRNGGAYRRDRGGRTGQGRLFRFPLLSTVAGVRIRGGRATLPLMCEGCEGGSISGGGAFAPSFHATTYITPYFGAKRQGPTTLPSSYRSREGWRYLIRGARGKVIARDRRCCPSSALPLSSLRRRVLH